EPIDAHARQQGESELRPDARDLQELSEQPALAITAEAIQHVRVLAHDQVRVQADLAAGRRQGVERRHRRFQLVADAAHVDEELRRLLGAEASAQKADHRAVPAARAASPYTPRECAWHSAIATASAAS